MAHARRSCAVRGQLFALCGQLFDDYQDPKMIAVASTLLLAVPSLQSS
jgi:hypothetical protein